MAQLDGHKDSRGTHKDSSGTIFTRIVVHSWTKIISFAGKYVRKNQYNSTVQFSEFEWFGLLNFRSLNGSEKNLLALLHNIGAKMKKRGRPRSMPQSKASKIYQRKSATIDEVVRFFARNAGARIRAARGWLGWSQKDLMKNSGVSLSTIRRMEAADIRRFRGEIRCMVKVVTTLEDNGAMFIDFDPHGDILGGVQFRSVPADTVDRYLWRTQPKTALIPASTKTSNSKGEDYVTID